MAITEEEVSGLVVRLPGFKFAPTGEELVGHYLWNKIQGDDDLFRDIIPVIDVCKYEPDHIAALFPDYVTEYFLLSPPDYKFKNSTRVNRLTEEGFYKPTGKERDVKDQSEEVIGKKRTLTYHRGRVPNDVKTDWVIHEYKLAETQRAKLVATNPNKKLEDLVICRLKNNKPAGYKKLTADSFCCEQGGNIAATSEDDQTAAAAAESDMILDPKEQPGRKDVLLGLDNGNHDHCIDSPNDSCLTENYDISTWLNDEPGDWPSDEPVSSIASSSIQDLAKAYFQTEDDLELLSYPFQQQDYALLSAIN